MTANWRLEGACNDADRSLFFGDWGEKPDERQAREARAKVICAPCAVRWKCAAYAISNGVKYGCWGGFGEDELAAERRKYLRRQRGYEGAAA